MHLGLASLEFRHKAFDVCLVLSDYTLPLSRRKDTRGSAELFLALEKAKSLINDFRLQSRWHEVINVKHLQLYLTPGISKTVPENRYLNISLICFIIHLFCDFILSFHLLVDFTQLLLYHI